MRRTRKILCYLLSIAFFLALSPPIYYAEEQVGEDQTATTNTSSITLNGVQPGVTYNLYKIFDMTTQKITSADSSSSIESYAYTVAAGWERFFKSPEEYSGADGLGSSFLADANDENTIKDCPILHDGKIKYIQLDKDNAGALQNFARFALVYVVDKKITADPKSPTIEKDSSDKEITIDGLSLGYYLIYPVGATTYLKNSGAICSLTSTTPTEVNIKSEYPTITNTLTNKDGSTKNVTSYYQIGDTVYYKIQGTIPDFSPYQYGYTYGISIEYSKGQKLIAGDVTPETLPFTSEAKDGSVLSKTVKRTKGPYQPDNTKDIYCVDFIFTLEDDYANYVGQPFELTYTTKVLPEAAKETKTTNRVSLFYSLDPNIKPKTESDNIGKFTCDPIEIYTCNIDITKFYGNNIPLENAKFALYKGETDRSYYQYSEAVSWTSDGDHTTVTTDNEGKGLFQGLGLGTYYLEETKAPDGFNKLAEPIEIEISLDNGEASYKIGEGSLQRLVEEDDGEGNHYLSVPVKVENKTGSLLPGTGGIGTVIFTITGVALIAAAGLFLLRKKQSEKVSEQ